MAETKLERLEPKKTVERQWFSYREAQAYASLGRTTLTSLVTSGAIPAAKVGKAVRISKAGLDDYLRKNLYAGGAQE